MPVRQPFTFFPGNDQIVLWQIISGETLQTPNWQFLSDATGTLTVYDPNGNPVAGANALSMSQVSGQPGVYQATIVGSLFNPSPAQNYYTVITLTSPSVNATGKWTIPTIIAPRKTG